MAITESDIIRHEQERSNLLRAIADVETAIAVSNPGTRRVLENTLENAKKRVDFLDKTIEDAKVEHAAEVQAQAVAVAALAAKEMRLNADERDTYSNFLNEDFFTKKDFGKLAHFYTHTWDRLSQSGKDEMSHRIWEGVRHHGYKFSDLPDPVKEREETQLYRSLHDSTLEMHNAARLPEDDKRDFIRAYESGNHKEAGTILERDGFKQNAFLGANSAAVRHSTASARKSLDANAVATTSSDGPALKKSDLPAPTDSLGSLDLASFDMAGMKSASHPLEGSVASLPRSRGGNFRES